MLVLALAGTFFCASSTPAQALPGRFWGMVPQSLPGSEAFARMKRGGVDWIRLPVSWRAVQGSPQSAPNWSRVDTAVAEASRVGIAVLPFIYDAPSWAVPTVPVPGSGGAVQAPRHLPVRGLARRAWILLLQSAVQRYGPSGSFWAENPGVPRRPIRTWQIWNEANFKYFVARPNPAEYGKLVKLSYTAIKGADRGARVLLGGMFARPGEARFKAKPRQAYFAAEFLEQMYRSTPGLKQRFDGASLHPYTGSYKRLPRYIEEFRSVLSANRDAAKPLWITELTWSSEPRRTERDGFAKGRRGQATQLKGAFQLLRQNQRKWRIGGVFWFSLQDSPGTCNFCDGSGLLGPEPALAPKPAWFAYVRFTGGSPR